MGLKKKIKKIRKQKKTKWLRKKKVQPRQARLGSKN